MIDMDKLSSDFPPGESGQEFSIAVFQPWHQPSVANKVDFRDGSLDSFSGLINSRIPGLAKGEEKFIHKGTIQCVRAWSDSKNSLYVREYIPCDHLAWVRVDESELGCGESRCGLRLQIKLETEKFIHLMFHLLLKQMNPSLPSSQYMDCTKAPPHYKGEHSWSEEFRKLGVVAFHTKLAGSSKSSPEVARLYRFGMILVPGMNTVQSCDGFDNWLRFLQTTHQQMIKDELNRLSSYGLGPRPETGSLTLIS